MKSKSAFAHIYSQGSDVFLRVKRDVRFFFQLVLEFIKGFECIGQRERSKICEYSIIKAREKSMHVNGVRIKKRASKKACAYIRKHAVKNRA